MKATATSRYVRMAPRKVRLVADMIRGQKAGDAQGILTLSPRKAAHDVEKLMRSALANLMNKDESGSININEAKVIEIRVDEGPTLKRWRPRAMGRATRINKRTSHMTITVESAE